MHRTAGRSPVTPDRQGIRAVCARQAGTLGARWGRRSQLIGIQSTRIRRGWFGGDLRGVAVKKRRRHGRGYQGGSMGPWRGCRLAGVYHALGSLVGRRHIGVCMASPPQHGSAPQYAATEMIP